MGQGRPFSDGADAEAAWIERSCGDRYRSEDRGINSLFLEADLEVGAFYKQYPNGVIDEFYFDTYLDHFLADIANEANV